MKDEDLRFIGTVRSKVTENPNLLLPVITAAVGGVDSAISMANERAADMETLASGAIGMLGEKRITAKTKQWYERLIISKLKKYESKTFCNWEWAIRRESK